MGNTSTTPRPPPMSNQEIISQVGYSNNIDQSQPHPLAIHLNWMVYGMFIALLLLCLYMLNQVIKKVNQCITRKMEAIVQERGIVRQRPTYDSPV